MTAPESFGNKTDTNYSGQGLIFSWRHLHSRRSVLEQPKCIENDALASQLALAWGVTVVWDYHVAHDFRLICCVHQGKAFAQNELATFLWKRHYWLIVCADFVKPL